MIGSKDFVLSLITSSNRSVKQRQLRDISSYQKRLCSFCYETLYFQGLSSLGYIKEINNNDSSNAFEPLQ